MQHPPFHPTQDEGRISTPPSKKHGRSLRWIVVGLAMIGLTACVAHVILQRTIDADFVERRLTEALAASSDSLYSVQIDRVAFGLLNRHVELENATLQPDSARLQRLLDAGTAPGARYTISIPRVQLDGLNLWRLLFTRHLAFGGLRIDSPHLIVEQIDSENQAAAPVVPDTSADAGEERSFHASLARQLPMLRLRHLYLDQGSLSLIGSPDEPAVTIPGISLQILNIVVDSNAVDDPRRVLFSDDVRFQIAPQQHFSADSLYVYETGLLQGSSKDAFLTIASLLMDPTVSDEAFMQRHRFRTPRYKVSTGAVSFAGVDFRQLLEHRAGLVGRLQIDSLRTDVYQDRALPVPTPAPHPDFPHEAIQGLDHLIRVDTVAVTHAEIRYSERAEDGARPGTISFEDTFGTVYDLTNDPAQAADPTVLDVQTQFMGTGSLKLRLQYWLQRPILTAAYRGSLGPIDPQVVNDLLLNLDGIEIESGLVDSLWFDVRMENDIASGALQVVYRDLKVEIRDKVTHERHLKHRIQTFLTNQTKLHSDNIATEEGPPRVAGIKYERTEEDPFIGMAWRAIRNGLFLSIGLTPPS